MTCPFIIEKTKTRCKNNTKDNALCKIHKRDNSIYILNLEKTNQEFKLAINELNNIIQRNKIAYDSNFQKYHNLLQEYGKVMECSKVIMDYNAKFKEEIKNLNKTIEKKSIKIKELEKYQPKEKQNTNYNFLKFDQLFEEFKIHCDNIKQNIIIENSTSSSTF